MKKVIQLVAIFVLSGYAMGGVFLSTIAHGGSMYWFLGGAIAFAAAVATLVMFVI